MIFLELFLAFFRIGLFSFGGGYAAVPLIQSEIVDGHKWLEMSQFADLITIAEMTPGPIAVNSATFVGQQIAGLPGAIVCTLGCIVPSFLIVLLLLRKTKIGPIPIIFGSGIIGTLIYVIGGF